MLLWWCCWLDSVGPLRNEKFRTSSFLPRSLQISPPCLLFTSTLFLNTRISLTPKESSYVVSFTKNDLVWRSWNCRPKPHAMLRESPLPFSWLTFHTHFFQVVVDFSATWYEAILFSSKICTRFMEELRSRTFLRLETSWCFLPPLDFMTCPFGRRMSNFCCLYFSLITLFAHQVRSLQENRPRL